MNPSPNPVHEWLTRPGGIAARLRAARISAHLTGKELSEQAGWAPSKVSRIELGNQTPTEDDLDTWARICGMDLDATAGLHGLLGELESSRIQWKHRLRSGLAPVQEDYNRLVARSDRVCHFETTLVPGLLQTREYAHQTFFGIAVLHRTPQDEVEGAVAKRMERQRHLYDTSKQFEFLISEPVMRWLLCPPEVMRGQLDRLQTVIGLPNIRFGVLPMGVMLKTAPQNKFELYDEAVHIETFTADERRSGEEYEKYREILDRLWEEAAEGEDARRLIVSAADGLPA